MKNKELALKISKHPLMEKVAKLEDKRVVARLVIEELLKESKNRFNEKDIQNITNIEKELQKKLYELTYNHDEGKEIYQIFDYSGKNLLGNTSNMQIKMVKGVDAPEPDTYLPSTAINLTNGMTYISQENMETLIEQIQKGKDSIKIKTTKIKMKMIDRKQYYEPEGSPISIIFKKVVAQPEQGDDDATEITATPEEQEQVQDAVVKVQDSLKDFFKYLKNKITGGAEIPAEEEKLEEGLFDNIKKGLERSPGRARGTFFKLLSKYLKDANVGIDLKPKDIKNNWDEWIEQGDKNRNTQASKIIAAYTYHFKTFWNKPELTGGKIKKAAQDILVAGKSKLDKFIEEIVGIALEEFKAKLKNDNTDLEVFKDTASVDGYYKDPKEYFEMALSKKIGNEPKKIQALINNDKFFKPADQQFQEKIKELHAEMFFEPEKNILEQIATEINENETFKNRGDFSVTAIKKHLQELLQENNMSDLFNNENEEAIKKHIKYLLEEDKRIADFIYNYITYPNTREDFKPLKPALKKLAAFLKKQENGYTLKESLNNLKDQFEGPIEKLTDGSNIFLFKKKELKQLNKFFKFKNNLDYFVDYFFGKDTLEEPEENKDENYIYSYLVLIALNNQTKKREAELKSYFSALKKRVGKLTKDNEKPQAEKYANLKNESVFLISKLKTYNNIIKKYMEYKKTKEPGSDITDNILEDFGNEFPDSDEVFKLIRWSDKSESLIQYEDKTLPASEVYLKDIEKWEELNGSEKAKAFLYDYRTLIRDKEDGEIKRFVDRVNRIDDQIRSGKEPAPRDEKIDNAIPKERYEYFLQEAKPIAKFLQETPITFRDGEINFGKEINLPGFNSEQDKLKDLVIQLKTNEFSKTKLFKYIGTPEKPDEAKDRIFKTIETLKAFQQAKKDGLADDEVAYDAFLGEIKDNLTYFQMGWPLFKSSGRGVKLNTPYSDNTKIQQMFSDEQLKDELVRMANMEGKQVKAAIKSKYSGKNDEQEKLTEKLNELTKERNFEIARDCANVYEEQGMGGPSYNRATIPPDRIFPQNRLKEESWNKIKKLINDIIKPFYSNHTDFSLPDIENKDRYKKFLEAYKEIVQIAKDDGQEKDITKNTTNQNQSKIDFQEQITKLIKPLIREKLKRKQNGKKNLRN